MPLEAPSVGRRDSTGLLHAEEFEIDGLALREGSAGGAAQDERGVRTLRKDEGPAVLAGTVGHRRDLEAVDEDPSPVRKRGLVLEVERADEAVRSDVFERDRELALVAR